MFARMRIKVFFNAEGCLTWRDLLFCRGNQKKTMNQGHPLFVLFALGDTWVKHFKSGLHIWYSWTPPLAPALPTSNLCNVHRIAALEAGSGMIQCRRRRPWGQGMGRAGGRLSWIMDGSQRVRVRLAYEWPPLQSPGLIGAHTYTSEMCSEC